MQINDGVVVVIWVEDLEGGVYPVATGGEGGVG